MSIYQAALSENKPLSEKKFFVFFMLILLFFSLLLFRKIAEQELPIDDALRHSAHAMHERSDSEIVLMRPEYSFDHNFGWHRFLRTVRKIFGFNQKQVLYFSIIFLYLLFHLAGIISSPHPLAWYFSFCIANSFLFLYVNNLIMGRPFLITSAAIMLLLRLWCVEKDCLSKKCLLLASFFILCAVCWLHGSWYLFLLFPLAFALAGRLKDAFSIFLLLLAAALTTALLSGDIFGYFNYHYNVTKDIFLKDIVNKVLVSELRPLEETFWVFTFFLMLIFIALISKKSLAWRKLHKDPAFVLWFISYIGSYKVLRLWRDWAVPALLFWLAWQLYILYPKFVLLKKKGVVAFLAIFLGLNSWIVNYNAKSPFFTFVPPKEIGCDFLSPENKPWMPDSGGMIYAVEMEIYYDNYFRYPHGDWKYYLAFEQELMPEDNLKQLRAIISDFTAENLKRWTDKMKPEDRMIFSEKHFNEYFKTRSEKKDPNEIDALEWKKIDKYYVGKLK